MDIVGPLVKSSGGHQYILVLCDYAKCFPKAFPLWTITAPAVLFALVQLFFRVGVADKNSNRSGNQLHLQINAALT